MRHRIEYNIIIALLILCAGQIATARTFDKIVAYINEDVITEWELEDIVKQRATTLQHTYRFSEAEALKRARQERPELLDRLIRQILLVETALTLKIEVTDTELEQYMYKFRTDAGLETEADFINELKNEGFTLVAFRERAKRNLMADKLVMQRIVPKLQVRESDIGKFFEENRDQLPTKTDTVHLRHIYIAFKPTEADREEVLQKVNALRDEAQAGADFELLAQRHALNKGQKSGAGALVELPVGDIDTLSPPFRTALSTLGEGEISEPIEGADGVFLFKILRKTDQQIAFRHLVVPHKISEDAIKDTNERARMLVEKLEAGDDFETLAQQQSDDLETRARGGDLGPRPLSELNPNTRQIIEKLAVGQHSTPIKTTYGLHIFKIDNRTPPELSEAEKSQIRIILREQQFQEEWQTYTDMLLGNAYVKIKPLE